MSNTPDVTSFGGVRVEYVERVSPLLTYWEPVGATLALPDGVRICVDADHPDNNECIAFSEDFGDEGGPISVTPEVLAVTVGWLRRFAPQFYAPLPGRAGATQCQRGWQRGRGDASVARAQRVPLVRDALTNVPFCATMLVSPQSGCGDDTATRRRHT